MKIKLPKLKLALFGDLHLTDRLPYTLAGDPYRKDALILFMHKAFETIVKKKVDLVITAGDICHETVLDSDSLDLLICFCELSRISEVPNIVVSGNHDSDRSNSILKFLKRFDEEHGTFYYSDSPTTHFFDYPDIPKMQVVSIPHMRDKLFLKEAKAGMERKSIRRKNGLYNILVGHQGIKGAMHGTMKGIHGINQEDIKKLSPGYDLMVFGHYHMFQVVGDNGLYTGPIQQTRIDERDINPGFSILTLPSRKLVFLENIHSPRFKIIEDYKIKREDIVGNIVKPIIDTENKTEEENLSFLKAVLSHDPYYLIRPKIKKKFQVKKLKLEPSLSKTDALRKTVSKLNIPESKKSEHEKDVLEFYERVGSTV